jgi:hypothetical protein
MTSCEAPPPERMTKREEIDCILDLLDDLPEGKAVRMLHKLTLAELVELKIGIEHAVEAAFRRGLRAKDED